MGTEWVESVLQGVLIPDRRIDQTWAAHSDFSQAGPSLDTPRADTDSNLALVATGTLRTPVEGVLRFQRSGFPGATGAGFVWRYQDDAVTRYRGSDPPSLAAYTRTLVPGDQGTSYPKCRFPTCLSLPNGGLLVAYQYEEGSGDTETSIRTITIDPDGTEASPVTVYQTASAAELGDLHPCLISLPGDRVLLVHWFLDDGVTNLAQLRVHRTDRPTADSTSWAQASGYALQDDGISTAALTGYIVGRMAGAYLNGQILLVAHLTNRDTTRDYQEGLWQFASSDLGASFSTVVEWEEDSLDNGNGGRGYPVLYVQRNRFVLHYLAFGRIFPADAGQGEADQDPLLDTRPWWLEVGSAYERITSAREHMVKCLGEESWGTLDGGADSWDDADLAAWADEQGVRYVAGRLTSSANEGVMVRSADYGTSWRAMGDVPEDYKVVTLTVSYAPSAAIFDWPITIDGEYLLFINDSSMLDSELAASIAAAINSHSKISQILTAEQSGDDVIITGRTKGYDFALIQGQTSRLSRVLTTAAVSRKGTWSALNDVDTYPEAFQGSRYDGRAALVHTYQADPALSSHEASLMLTTLGGYSSLTMPYRQVARQDYEQLTWENEWLAYNEPSDLSWTTSTTGGSFTLNDDATATTVTTAQQKFHTEFMTSDATLMAQGFVAEWQGLVTSGGSLATNQVGLSLIVTDGAGTSAGVTINMTPTGFRVVDQDAAGNYEEVAVDLTSEVELRAFISASICQVFYRVLVAGNDRDFIPLDPLTLTGGTTVGDGRIAWGHIGLVTANSTVRAVRYATIPSGWRSPAASVYVNPDDLYPQALSADPTLPTPWVEGGRLQGVDGPAYELDQFTLATVYRYGVRNVLPAVRRSPRDPWRSLDATAQTLAWRLSPDDLAPGMPETDALGLALLNINWRTATLKGFNQALGSLVTLESLDAAVGATALAYTRQGDMIYPSSGAAQGSRWYHEGELIGGFADLGSSKLRKIRWNSAGVWTGASTSKQPQLRVMLSDTDNTEPASGTCALCAPRLLLYRLNTVNYTGYQLVVDALPTGHPDSFVQTGTMVMGSWRFFGERWGHGMAQTVQGGQLRIRQVEDGRRFVRLSSPAARTWAVEWADEVWMRSLQGANPNPDYITYAASGAVLGGKFDTPDQVAGLVERLNGPLTPVVMASALRHGGGTSLQLTDRETWLYGTLGEVRLENVRGGERSASSVRVGQILMSEEL